MAVTQMTKGSISKQLILFSIPILISNLFQQLYNTVDTAIVGRFVGANALAAVGTCNLVVVFMIYFFIGLSNGSSIVLSQSFGENDEEKVFKTVHTTMGLSFISGIVLMIVGLLSAETILKMINTPDDVIGYAVTSEFNINAIISVCIIFMVSAAETIGDTSAVVAKGLDREITEREISGSLACDGFLSSVTGLFGCPPVTSFSQNVGLVAMTKVVNRFTIMTGAMFMILAGFVPPIGAFFSSIPESVLGGCTLMMFGTIVVSGIEMLARAGFTQRNIIIIALSLAIGIGFTSVTEAEIWAIFPKMIQDIFSGNCVAVVFVVSIILNLVLPKNMEIEKLAEAA